MTLADWGKRHSTSYFERADYYDFSFAQPFDTYTVENAPFYNVKQPFTLFSYIEWDRRYIVR